MDFSFINDNTRSRQRLEALARGLAAADLLRASPDGWTVAALLAHLAFWDRRVLVLLRRWQVQGVDQSPVDPDMINDSLKPLCLALEPQAAVELCLAAAREVDSALAEITLALMEEIQASENHFRFNRSHHRNDHMAEIERLLGLEQTG